MGEIPNEKHDQRYRTQFLDKYGGISLYDIDIEMRYTIEDEYINFIKEGIYDLIGNPDNPDGTSTDHEYYIIHDDLFEIVLETNHNSDIVSKVIYKYVSLPSINFSSTYSRSKLSNRSKIISPCHKLDIKYRKGYMISHNCFDDFKLIVVNPPPK